jgi:hypothetical protein
MNSSDEKAAFHQTGAIDVNKGKEKEQEDVLPYLQNAILEQQSVESGPLPIQRLDMPVRATTTASSITTTMSMAPPSPTKGGAARQNDEDVLPYLQNAVLEQHTAVEKPLQIQRLDGSLSDSGTRLVISFPPPVNPFSLSSFPTTRACAPAASPSSAGPLLTLAGLCSWLRRAQPAFGWTTRAGLGVRSDLVQQRRQGSRANTAASRDDALSAASASCVTPTAGLGLCIRLFFSSFASSRFLFLCRHLRLRCSAASTFRPPPRPLDDGRGSFGLYGRCRHRRTFGDLLGNPSRRGRRTSLPAYTHRQRPQPRRSWWL